MPAKIRENDKVRKQVIVNAGFPNMTYPNKKILTESRTKSENKKEAR